MGKAEDKGILQKFVLSISPFEFESMAPFIFENKGALCVVLDATRPLQDRQRSFKALLPKIENYCIHNEHSRPFFIIWINKTKDLLGLKSNFKQ